MAESSKSKLYFGIALVAILLFSLFLILQIVLLQRTLRVVVNAVARIFFLSIKAPPTTQQNALDTSTWKTYRNEKYGFEMRYPKDYAVIEGGPDSYELQLREGKAISVTQTPLLEQVDVKAKTGEVVITIDIPDNTNLGVVSGEYEWWLRPCGQEGFATILTKEKTNVAGYKTLHVVSEFEYPPASPKSTRTAHFYCINFPRQPIIINFGEEFQEQANQILSTFKFTK